MNEHERYSEDCGAYVLGALEEPEAEALRAHMEACVLCREEIGRLRAVAEVMGLGVPALVAPPELRRRVLATVTADATPRERARRYRWRPERRGFGAGLLFAGTLALGLVLGALVLAPGGSSTRVIPASVALAPRWHAKRAPSAALRETGTQGQLVFNRLPPAPAGKIYEVWIERGATVMATPVLFNATAAGAATVAVPDLGGASAVLVTAERLGGSNTPTMKPLVQARLS
jgi:hypothetical protein